MVNSSFEHFRISSKEKREGNFFSRLCFLSHLSELSDLLIPYPVTGKMNEIVTSGLD